jgi:hypothetical protein
LADVGKLASKEKIGLGRRWQGSCLIAKIFKYGLEQALGAPMESPKKNLDLE